MKKSKRRLIQTENLARKTKFWPREVVRNQQSCENLFKKNFLRLHDETIPMKRRKAIQSISKHH